VTEIPLSERQAATASAQQGDIITLADFFHSYHGHPQLTFIVSCLESGTNSFG
jgi:hypothetical protein